jgi:hypothetical protein
MNYKLSVMYFFFLVVNWYKMNLISNLSKECCTQPGKTTRLNRFRFAFGIMEISFKLFAFSLKLPYRSVKVYISPIHMDQLSGCM